MKITTAGNSPTHGRTNNHGMLAQHIPMACKRYQLRHLLHNQRSPKFDPPSHPALTNNEFIRQVRHTQVKHRIFPRTTSPQLSSFRLFNP